eukprot:CAMPEP_0202704864 /NCGR_PEP_ID=MMETSP1385-20130828/17477_1 /ASSEMBLY_ACC=CAM_ASM_000861 /TAXON_ID=933848 /ORGANISM="Elphidium margaritaceum" /LENGTH=624 /DNA_ID=CAMNT_0049362977 /DNA_START=63 /DNA_END=1934 /DNA_ORIENTATION=+
MTTSSKGKTTNANNLEIYVSWKSLSFKVPDPKDKNKTKTILEELNGYVKPSEVCAVIGPSGSGKSSFLNCIAGRNVDGVTGQILFNEVPRPINFARFTGYVIQDDVYFESLTVYETLKFAANLKLPTALSQKSKLDRVQELMDELDLHKCKDTVIGTVGKGISGGERRRLAIGLEIINHPSLLLLDEPTSGLDSASALMVGNILRRLAQTRQITILCTVHQPRYKLAAMFDKLYFLGKGQELYFGPSVPQCLQFFEDAGYKCPDYENPADFLLDLVNTADTAANELTSSKEEKDDEEKNEDSRDAIVTKLANAYKASELSKQALAYEVSTSAHGDQMFASISSEFYITPMYNQIIVITKRSFLHKWREPIATMTQAFNSIVMPLLFGSVYWQLDLSQQSAYDRISAIALLVLTLSFLPFDVLMLFPLERTIFNREQASGMYRPISFFVGRTLAETPQHIIFSILTATIAYWMYGLQNSLEHFLRFVLICIAMVLSGSGLLILFSTMARNLEQSNLLATFFLLLFMLFDGNWISIDKVPALWKWVRYISCLGYASQAAIVSEYEGLVFECNEQEINDGLCQNVNGITGEEIIYIRGLQDVDVMFNVMMLFVLAAAYRLLAFLFFW